MSIIASELIKLIDDFINKRQEVFNVLRELKKRLNTLKVFENNNLIELELDYRFFGVTRLEFNVYIKTDRYQHKSERKQLIGFYVTKSDSTIVKCNEHKKINFKKDLYDPIIKVINTEGWKDKIFPHLKLFLSSTKSLQKEITPIKRYLQRTPAFINNKYLRIDIELFKNSFNIGFYDQSGRINYLEDDY